MNILYIGQAFTEIYGVFHPDDNGKTIIRSVDWKELSVLTTTQNKKLWILPNGNLIRLRLKPFKAYNLNLGRYYNSRDGRTQIFGYYPFYQTQFGDRVYIDADGAMSIVDPGPIEQRLKIQLQEKYRERSKWRLVPNRLRPSKERKKNRKPLIDIFCDNCGGHFQASHSRRRFCSDHCRVRAWRKQIDK